VIHIVLGKTPHSQQHSRSKGQLTGEGSQVCVMRGPSLLSSDDVSGCVLVLPDALQVTQSWGTCSTSSTASPIAVQF